MQHLLKFTKLATCAAALALFVSCSKSDDTDASSGTAKTSLTNASPDAAASDLYVDNVKITAAPLGFGSTTSELGSPYLTVTSGSRSVRVSPNGTTNYTQGTIPFTKDNHYSIFVLDTLSATSTLKGLVLLDNLTAPAAGKAHVRFVHLSPDAGNVYVDFAKTNDTTKISNRPYVGNIAVSDPAMGNFTAINSGAYNINIKAGTTDPVLVGLPYTFAEGKIYTVYLKGLKSNGYGTANPAGVNPAVILHN
jgi:hypothetical protein